MNEYFVAAEIDYRRQQAHPGNRTRRAVRPHRHYFHWPMVIGGSAN